MVDVKKYEGLTYKIIGCAMQVHKALGNGFQEVLYQRALEIEMKINSLEFEREKSMDIFYKGQLLGKRRSDFLVEGKVVIELKAVSKLDDNHLNQTLNYLEAFGLEVALLINFGSTALEYKRILNNKPPYKKD